MLIGYNQATSMKHSTLENDLELCKKYGYYGLEMQTDLMDKYMETHTPEDLRKLFADSGVKALPVNALTSFNIRSEEQDKRFHYICSCAQAAGAEAVILVAAMKDISLEASAEAARHYLAIAGGYGLRLALEFMGVPGCSVKSLEEASCIADKAPGLKLVLDCAHMMAGPTDYATILKLIPEKIESVHIDDICRNMSGVYSDADRVWPGDGNMGLDEIFKNLNTIGYDGLVSVEMFNEEYWEWPVEKAYETAMQKTVSFLKMIDGIYAY